MKRVALALACVLGAATASAGVPSPSESTVDPCFVSCPFGDVAFSVTVRDFAHNPIAGSTVALAFSDCSGVRLCPNQEPGTTVSPSPLMAIRSTDATGVVTFHLHAGGLCPGAQMTVYADGVNLGQRSVASPDQNGDLIVDATDQALLAALVGGSDLGGDLDCDQMVNTSDVTVQSSHLGHACDSATPTRPKSWGRLKLLYR